jgi:hypothetical protein
MQIPNGPWLMATDARNVGKAERWFKHIPPRAQDAPVLGGTQQVLRAYHDVPVPATPFVSRSATRRGSASSSVSAQLTAWPCTC